MQARRTWTIQSETPEQDHARLRAGANDIAGGRQSRGKLYDAAAGPYRNERMLREGRPEYAIAFPGGRGTRDMMIRCWEYGLEPFVPLRSKREAAGSR